MLYTKLNFSDKLCDASSNLSLVEVWCYFKSFKKKLMLHVKWQSKPSYMKLHTFIWHEYVYT